LYNYFFLIIPHKGVIRLTSELAQTYLFHNWYQCIQQSICMYIGSLHLDTSRHVGTGHSDTCVRLQIHTFVVRNYTRTYHRPCIVTTLFSYELIIDWLSIFKSTQKERLKGKDQDDGSVVFQQRTSDLAGHYSISLWHIWHIP
jgi:hypothetical protein